MGDRRRTSCRGVASRGGGAEVRVAKAPGFFAEFTLSNAEGLRMTKWGELREVGVAAWMVATVGCSFAPFDYAQGRQPNP